MLGVLLCWLSEEMPPAPWLYDVLVQPYPAQPEAVPMLWMEAQSGCELGEADRSLAQDALWAHQALSDIPSFGSAAASAASSSHLDAIVPPGYSRNSPSPEGSVILEELRRRRRSSEARQNASLDLPLPSASGDMDAREPGPAPSPPLNVDFAPGSRERLATAPVPRVLAAHSPRTDAHQGHSPDSAPTNATDGVSQQDEAAATHIENADAAGSSRQPSHHSLVSFNGSDLIESTYSVNGQGDVVEHQRLVESIAGRMRTPIPSTANGAIAVWPRRLPAEVNPLDPRELVAEEAFRFGDFRPNGRHLGSQPSAYRSLIIPALAPKISDRALQQIISSVSDPYSYRVMIIESDGRELSAATRAVNQDAGAEFVVPVHDEMEFTLPRSAIDSWMERMDPNTTIPTQIPPIGFVSSNVWFVKSESSRCVICQQDWEAGATVVELKRCSHRVHADCIAQWLMRRDNCPTCRTRLA